MHITEALPLPLQPDVEQYRKLAKELLAAVRSDAPDAVSAWAHRWIANLWRLAGEPDTPELRGWTEEFVAKLDRYWKGQWVPKGMPAPRATLAGTQLVLARLHGFGTWGALVRHIEAARRGSTPVARFEAAVDAIVSGDLDGLERLLVEHPGLARERSSRSHGATLLHYVSANGVEGYRQKTPPNVVDIAKLLLGAGADPNVKAECYAGGDTPLGLTATSAHPANAGVMTELLATLVAAGADVNSRDGGRGLVRSALANGQPEAAAWLADHGAALDLEEAAGVGRLDLVRRFVAEDGTLRHGATERQLAEGFRWACGYAHLEVVELLLARGVDPRRPAEGESTGLHSAAYEGHADVVELLLRHGAPVDHREHAHGGTPLDWALYGWGGRREAADSRHHEVVAALVRAGARVDPSWLEETAPRRIAARIREDPQMRGALAGGEPRAGQSLPSREELHDRPGLR